MSFSPMVYDLKKNISSFIVPQLCRLIPLSFSRAISCVASKKRPLSEIVSKNETILYNNPSSNNNTLSSHSASLNKTLVNESLVSCSSSSNDSSNSSNDSSNSLSNDSSNSSSSNDSSNSSSSNSSSANCSSSSSSSPPGSPSNSPSSSSSDSPSSSSLSSDTPSDVSSSSEEEPLKKKQKHSTKKTKANESKSTPDTKSPKRRTRQKTINTPQHSDKNNTLSLNLKNSNEKLKHSSNTPFRRVDPNIKVDDKFKDSPIHAYGEKAFRDLGPKKGKDFRTEKNKKKRGSYKGGAIDTECRSIKFDSD